MLHEEKLSSVKPGLYEEPDGEFLELINVNINTITVLTRVEEVGPPIDPSDYSVNELKDELRGRVLSEDEVGALIEEEKDGKNRVTALQFFNDIET